MKKLVFFEYWADPVAEEILGEAPGVELQRLGFADPEEATWRALEAAHGFHTLPAVELEKRWHPTAELIGRCKNLLAVSSTGAGYDIIDVAACTEAGIMVVNNTGANSVSVSQHVLGMMLALSKNIIQLDRLCRKEAGVDRMQHVGRELTGKTLGIVGLGNIGRRVSALAGQAFGMRVIAYDPYISDADFAERGADKVDFDTLFREADFVSVNCPLTAETRGMVDERAFRLMKHDAYFITTARGGIHDEVGLEKVLDERLIAGAGLDVFAVEPPGPGHPLMRFHNVVISPHVAGITDVCNHGMAKAAAEQWVDILSGRRPPRLVNPEVWPTYVERYKRITGDEVCG